MMEWNFARSSSCAEAKNVVMTSTIFRCSAEDGGCAIPRYPLAKTKSTMAATARVVYGRRIKTNSLKHSLLDDYYHCDASTGDWLRDGCELVKTGKLHRFISGENCLRHHDGAEFSDRRTRGGVELLFPARIKDFAVAPCGGRCLLNLEA